MVILSKLPDMISCFGACRLVPSQTCTSAFATRDRLRAHLVRHEEKVPCHICGKLLSAAYITDHMRVHNQAQHHSCHLCNRSESREHHTSPLNQSIKAASTILRLVLLLLIVFMLLDNGLTFTAN